MTNFNSIKDVRLALKRPPILAIHGSASNGGFWESLSQACASSRLVFAPDLSGYGRHDDKRAKLDSTLYMRAEPLIETIRNIPQGVHLVAHSFGASVALEIVRVIPDKVKSITFYEPVVPALLRNSERSRDLELLGDLVALSDIVRGTGAKVGMESFINFWGGALAWDRLSERARETLAGLAPVVYQDFIEAYRNLPPKPVKPISYQGSLKVILGERVNEHAERMAKLLIAEFQQTTTEVLEGMGHMGPMTHPAIVNFNILEHIARVEQQGSEVPMLAQA